MVADLLTFIEESPTPLHCVTCVISRLEQAGFKELFLEKQDEISPGKYFTTNDEGSVIAVVLPDAVSRFHMIGAHTDSPNLRLRRNASFQKEGYGQLSVEPYGGVLLHTWLDRDLAIAGRVFIAEQGEMRTKLIDINRPLCRVPSLAIHLHREINKEGLKLDREKHLRPVLTLSEDKNILEKLIAEVAETQADKIISYDLSLYEFSKPVLSGAENEFIHSSRLDNQAMCHAGLLALTRAEHLESAVFVLALFDHEEIGSQSQSGADSAFFTQALENILHRYGISRSQYLSMLSQSSFLSADMAHAVHPNYENEHGEHHRPYINAGPVIKINENQRYATNGEAQASLMHLCQEKNFPYQVYHHRNDIPCGSTIGPMVSSQLGIKTVDIGNPLLSMHSIREMAGTKDHEKMIELMKCFYEEGL